jgi:hypothetical protein
MPLRWAIASNMRVIFASLVYDDNVMSMDNNGTRSPSVVLIVLGYQVGSPRSLPIHQWCLRFRNDNHMIETVRSFSELVDMVAPSPHLISSKPAVTTDTATAILATVAASPALPSSSSSADVLQWQLIRTFPTNLDLACAALYD